MNATIEKYGFTICTYIHDGRKYRQHYLTEGTCGLFWSRSPARALVFEDENDAREVAASYAQSGYWVARKVLADSAC